MRERVVEKGGPSGDVHGIIKQGESKWVLVQDKMKRGESGDREEYRRQRGARKEE
jgi:hypothetical protein